MERVWFGSGPLRTDGPKDSEGSMKEIFPKTCGRHLLAPPTSGHLFACYHIKFDLFCSVLVPARFYNVLYNV